MAQAKLYFLTVCKLLEVWDHCMGYLISAPCILNTRNDSTIVNGEVLVGGNRFNTCIIGKETTINFIGSQSSDELRLMGFTKLRSSQLYNFFHELYYLYTHLCPTFKFVILTETLKNKQANFLHAGDNSKIHISCTFLILNIIIICKLMKLLILNV